jgi:transketolase
VQVCLAAAALLRQDGLQVQVTSLPCWDLFAQQPEEHIESVLPAAVPTLAVEAGTTFGWDRWADDAVGIDHFGASAPGEVVLREMGFTGEHVAERARALLEELEEDA